MRIFHALVFDTTIEGTTALYSDPQYNDPLGAADALSLFAVGDTASGTSPTLTAQMEESGDQVHWNAKAGTAEINAASLSTSANTIAVGRDSGSTPSSGFVRLKVSLGGTSPKARIRLWATGRGDKVQ